MKIPLSIIACALFLGSTLCAPCGEILLHSGPTTSTPISSLSSPERTAEELIFVKQFYIGSAPLAKLPAPHQPPASVLISADRAAELAKPTVDPGGTPREFKVTKNDLLVATVGDSKMVEYYLIEILVNGSTEHRIVLMDGTVIKPHLKRVKDSRPMK